MENNEIEELIEYINCIINVIKLSKYSFIQSDFVYFIESIKKQVEALKEDE